MINIGIDVDKSGKIWTSTGDNINDISPSLIVRRFIQYVNSNNIRYIYHEDTRCWTTKFKKDNRDLIRVLTLLKSSSISNLLVPVEPYNTSIICSICHNKDKRSRINKYWFVCKKCKRKIQADVNAARNILQKGKKRSVVYSR